MFSTPLSNKRRQDIVTQRRPDFCASFDRPHFNPQKMMKKKDVSLFSFLSYYSTTMATVQSILLFD
jgi:hypothetical protein